MKSKGTWLAEAVAAALYLYCHLSGLCTVLPFPAADSASFKNKENIDLSHVTNYAQHEKDVGSAEVQIARLTARVQQISSHLKVNRKDFGSKRGLEAVLSQRKRLMRYLYKTNRSVASCKAPAEPADGTCMHSKTCLPVCGRVIMLPCMKSPAVTIRPVVVPRLILFLLSVSRLNVGYCCATARTPML